MVRRLRSAAGVAGPRITWEELTEQDADREG
jgi:hypothetical protein